MLSALVYEEIIGSVVFLPASSNVTDVLLPSVPCLDMPVAVPFPISLFPLEDVATATSAGSG